MGGSKGKLTRQMEKVILGRVSQGMTLTQAIRLSGVADSTGRTWARKARLRRYGCRYAELWRKAEVIELGIEEASLVDAVARLRAMHQELTQALDQFERCAVHHRARSALYTKGLIKDRKTRLLEMSDEEYYEQFFQDQADESSGDDGVPPTGEPEQEDELFSARADEDHETAQPPSSVAEKAVSSRDETKPTADAVSRISRAPGGVSRVSSAPGAVSSKVVAQDEPELEPEPVAEQPPRPGGGSAALRSKVKAKARASRKLTVEQQDIADVMAMCDEHEEKQSKTR